MCGGPNDSSSFNGLPLEIPARVLGASMDVSAAAYSHALRARRLVFLHCADPMKIPPSLHAWLALRPPYSQEQKPSLFGWDALSQVRLAAKAHRDVQVADSMATVASTVLNRSQQRGTKLHAPSPLHEQVNWLNPPPVRPGPGLWFFRTEPQPQPSTSREPTQYDSRKPRRQPHQGRKSSQHRGRRR